MLNPRSAFLCPLTPSLLHHWHTPWRLLCKHLRSPSSDSTLPTISGLHSGSCHLLGPPPLAPPNPFFVWYLILRKCKQGHIYPLLTGFLRDLLQQHERWKPLTLSQNKISASPVHSLRALLVCSPHVHFSYLQGSAWCFFGSSIWLASSLI